MSPKWLDYLQGELKSDTKHEFIQGEIYAMAGASEDHGSIDLPTLGYDEFRLQYPRNSAQCRTYSCRVGMFKVNPIEFLSSVLLVSGRR